MDKAEFSGRKISRESIEDIPEALRDIPNAQKRSRKRLVFAIALFISGGAIALAAGFWYITSAPPKNPNPSPSITPSPIASQNPQQVNPPTQSDNLLGHLAYGEAPPDQLQPIVADANIKLRRTAAQEFKAMVRAARASGVVLVPISGFRSVKDQQHVFFDIKAQRGQTATKRAEVSAPPGYSEHHTGYAVDIGDGAVPATNLNQNFDKTKAFKWLASNAASFNFEMSFPQNNPQGVSYEPWHWRFVGDRDSLETFYKARGKSTK